MLDVPVGVGVKELGILRPEPPALGTPEERLTLGQAGEKAAAPHHTGAQ